MKAHLNDADFRRFSLREAGIALRIGKPPVLQGNFDRSQPWDAEPLLPGDAPHNRPAA